MPEVFSTLTKPGGAPKANEVVRIRLIASANGEAEGFVAATDTTILDEYATLTDSTGRWAVTLDANALITPANSVYQVIQPGIGGGKVTETFAVPNAAGPFWLGDILETAPVGLPQYGLDVHANDVAAHAGELAPASHLTDATAHTGTLAPLTTAIGGGVQRVNEGALSMLDPRVGGDNTNVNDNVAAIAAAVALIPVNGGELFFPRGTYQTRSMVAVTQRKGIRFVGESKHGAILAPTAALGANPTVRFTDYRDCGIDHMWVQGAGVATAAIEGRRATVGQTARNLRITNVRMGGNGTNDIQTGVRFTAAGGADTNNDTSYVEDCEIVNFSVAAISIEHFNSLKHTFAGLQIGPGPIGIRTTAGGTFTMIGGHMGSISDCMFDFAGGTNGGSIYIIGVQSEAAQRLLRTDTSLYRSINFVGCELFGLYAPPYNINIIDLKGGNGGFAGVSTILNLFASTIYTGQSGPTMLFENVNSTVNMLGTLVAGVGPVTANGQVNWHGSGSINFALGASATLNYDGGKAAPGLESVLATATDQVLRASVSGDTNKRLTVAADGTMSWGSGAAAADLTLARDGIARGRVTGSLGVTANLVGGGSAGSARGQVTAMPTAVGNNAFAAALLSGQTGDALAILDSAFATLSRINKAGYYMTRKTAAPADADLANGELAFWLDATAGATKAMFKAKDAAGTVRTGSVALA